MNFEKFVQRKIKGLNVLRISTENYGPGTVINQRANDIRVGHLKDIFTDWETEKWKVDRMNANLLHGENVEGSFSAGVNATILGMFKVGANVQLGTTIDYKIDEIVASELLNTSHLELDNAFDTLKVKNRPQWKKYKGYTYITESFYAKSFSITFKRNGTVMAEADIKANISVVGSANVTWSGGGTIIVAGNNKVPFGVRGFKVRP